MTYYFDRVAESMVSLPGAESTRELIGAWTHGTSLRRDGIDDMSTLIRAVLSKTTCHSIAELCAECILIHCSFEASDIHKTRQIKMILELFQILCILCVEEDID